jgi:hypothetical protein
MKYARGEFKIKAGEGNFLVNDNWISIRSYVVNDINKLAFYLSIVKRTNVDANIGHQISYRTPLKQKIDIFTKELDFQIESIKNGNT